MSDGVSTTVSLAGVTDEITLKLKGESQITVPKGSYSEQGIIIIKNGEETVLTPTSITYYNNTTNTPSTLELMNSMPGIYTVTYNYESKSISRNVTIQ